MTFKRLVDRGYSLQDFDDAYPTIFPTLLRFYTYNNWNYDIIKEYFTLPSGNIQDIETVQNCNYTLKEIDDNPQKVI